MPTRYRTGQPRSPVAEHATNPGFETFGDALWWAIVTLTTVGYGDVVQETAGRVDGVMIVDALEGRAPPQAGRDRKLRAHVTRPHPKQLADLIRSARRASRA